MSCAGKVEYFYAKNGAWQVTDKADEIYYFANGQRELHYGDGTKAILYPNGRFTVSDSEGELMSDADDETDIPDVLLNEPPCILEG